MNKKRGVHPSKDGLTVAITLRFSAEALGIYDEVAAKANLLNLQKGGRGQLTVQDVMRHRLLSLPLCKSRLAKSGKGKDQK